MVKCAPRERVRLQAAHPAPPTCARGARRRTRARARAQAGCRAHGRCAARRAAPRRDPAAPRAAAALPARPGRSRRVLRACRRFTIEEIRERMNYKFNIRNLSGTSHAARRKRLRAPRRAKPAAARPACARRAHARRPARARAWRRAARL
jgi:hypothetical protein